MILLEGEQTCSRCGLEFTWNGYDSKKDIVFTISNLPHNISSITQDNNGNYIVITNCPRCGHKDEANNIIIR